MNMSSAEVYQIKVRGRLDARWSDSFGGMAIACQVGRDGLPTTTLTGAVVDQAALRGILCKLWDLNLTILSVHQIDRPEKVAGEKEGTENE